MKKTEKNIYLVIILILVVVISCGITYILTINKNHEETKEPVDNDKKEETPNKEELILEDGVTLKNTTMNNDTIIQEYEIILNGKKQNIKIIYTYQLNEDGSEMIEGKLNNEKIYSVLTMNEIPNKDAIFDKDIIEKNFNEKNFSLIKGEDNKNYLTIYNYDSNFITPPTVGLYILNDNLDFITEGLVSNDGCNTKENFMTIASPVGYQLENNISPWYENTFINFDNNLNQDINIKIENNQIYYLVVNKRDSNTENNYGNLEERIYTINNNKLNYKIKNNYKIIEVKKGQVC